MNRHIVHYPFPVAAHTYFQLKDLTSTWQAFLKNQDSEPNFIYKWNIHQSDIILRMAVVESVRPAYLNLALVLSSLRLRHDGNELDSFREANKALYPEPRADYATAIIAHYATMAQSDEERQLLHEIEDKLGEKISPQNFTKGPSDQDFQYYRQLFEEYCQLPSKDQSVVHVIEELLDTTRLASEGWRVKLLNNDEHAKTLHGAHTIAIGRLYKPRTKLAVLRIAVHEIIGHALRGQQASIDESEGFAIVLEQLIDTRFKLRRSYRYLAVALGYGTNGRPMSFRQVYEILWRIMVISGKRSSASAQQYAFRECCRAFRGGRPDIAGAVYLKDALYFDANLRIWQVLTSRHLEYNEFKEVIEGKRAILS